MLYVFPELLLVLKTVRKFLAFSAALWPYISEGTKSADSQSILAEG